MSGSWRVDHKNCRLTYVSGMCCKMPLKNSLVRTNQHVKRTRRDQVMAKVFPYVSLTSSARSLRRSLGRLNARSLDRSIALSFECSTMLDRLFARPSLDRSSVGRLVVRLPDRSIERSLNRRITRSIGHWICIAYNSKYEYACFMIIVHACTMMIILACIITTIHAYTRIIEHALTLTIRLKLACTMIIVHARTVVRVHGYSIITIQT